MKHFKLFEDFTGETLNANEVRATELIILFTLRQLLPDGGNFVGDAVIDWQKLDAIFKKDDSPDLYINFDPGDIKGFSGEFNTLVDIMSRKSMKRQHVYDMFEKYGLKLEVIHSDECIAGLDLPATHLHFIHDSLTQVDLEFIADFYRTREKKIKELEQKYKTTLTSRKYGL